MKQRKFKPHIKRSPYGYWMVKFGGEVIYRHEDMTEAFISAEHVWKYQ